ncbi:hypothetical protein FSARC_7656 [Fusarium sarcochroum]|uniref:Uncharacterized protein n=1 Tax=Fusarium sarcochroum TaxID=1208366 RepID=A0A8H4TUS4_9HYPO|nr:hypothetical protein FSARC_7656 [Fusarium sarcochroum]
MPHFPAQIHLGTRQTYRHMYLDLHHFALSLSIVFSQNGPFALCANDTCFSPGGILPSPSLVRHALLWTTRQLSVDGLAYTLPIVFFGYHPGPHLENDRSATRAKQDTQRDGDELASSCKSCIATRQLKKQRPIPGQVHRTNRDADKHRRYPAKRRIRNDPYSIATHSAHRKDGHSTPEQQNEEYRIEDEVSQDLLCFLSQSQIVQDRPKLVSSGPCQKACRRWHANQESQLDDKEHGGIVASGKGSRWTEQKTNIVSR